MDDFETTPLVSSHYVEHGPDGYAVTGSRVSLDSIVHAFVSGESAESIAQAFPVLTLEQVYGAITFYLAHRDEVDRYLKQRRGALSRDRHRVVLARSTSRKTDAVAATTPAPPVRGRCVEGRASRPGRRSLVQKPVDANVKPFDLVS